LKLRIGVGLFGIGRRQAAAPLDRLLTRAELAERLGFHSVWVPESHFEPAGSLPAPLVLLAAVAARTRTIGLGTTSYLLSVRHPIRVAEDVAVLDQLSAGRVIFGIGRGFRPSLFEAFDSSAAEKRERFEEALGTILRAWRGEPLGEADPAIGEPLRVTPRPVQQPHPPIWVAAFGPKALAQAGRLGLPYLASPLEPLPLLEANYRRHREAMREPDRARTLPVPVIRTVFATRDACAASRVRGALEEQARALAADGRSWIARAAGAPLDEWALIGEPARIADLIARYQERIGLSHLIARVQVPGAEPIEVEGSLEMIAELAAG
jgi:alkanesulfonate monooxygenase SsuD/methylene tetrahydromethanopterin reductase-like flavin-dependent oxidoreductase (luciferase family)